MSYDSNRIWSQAENAELVSHIECGETEIPSSSCA